jgi:hypothetical protein
MDITPHVNLLKSLRGERVNYSSLIGEGIDNALDAGARSVKVKITDEKIKFEDDGVGITRDRIASLFSLGSHGEMSTTKLGRFGIGIKHHAVNAGNVFKVWSASQDGTFRISVNWKQVLKDGRWHVDDPKWLGAIDAKSGTVIEIAELRKAPRGSSIDRLHQDAALQFYPAIADGSYIVINGQQVELLPEPDMTDIVERQFALSGGRAAKLRGGILVHQPSKLNRVHVAYKHRVIMPGSTLGCGEYGGLNKMFARLQLSGPWHLARFKDDLTDEAEREELEEAVEDALRPILEKCNTQSMTARIANLSRALNDLLPPDMSAARPHSQKDHSKPAEKKQRTESGVVDDDKSDEGGPAKARKPQKNRLLITFDGDVDDHGLGSYERGHGRAPQRVDLSKDHPFVAQLIAHRDEALAEQSLYAVAIMLFEHGRSDQGELYLSFGKRVAEMLDIQGRPEGRKRA